MADTLYQKKMRRFSDVAHAIEISPDALRKWLQRGEVCLPAEPGARGWRNFSDIDVIVLAITHRLSGVGMSLAEACRFAWEAVQFALERLKALPNEASLIFGGVSGTTIAGMLLPVSIVITVQDDGERVAECRTASELAELPASDLIGEGLPRILVPVGPVIVRAFDRLNERILKA